MLGHVALAEPEAENRRVVPYAGVEIRPFSRADLVWVEDGRTTGTTVGEFDGVVDPAVSAYIGAWLGPWIGLQGGLGIARLQTTTYVGESFYQQHWGVVRPSLDARVALMRRRDRFPVPWAMVGLFVDLPSARDVSDAYSEEEQLAADESASIDRLALWGLGGRLGLGVDYRLLPGIAVGAQVTLGYTQSVLASQDANTVSSWLASSGALLLHFEWPPVPPGKKKRRSAAADLEGAGDVEGGAQGPG